MLVALNDSWKVPCGYFFINPLDGIKETNSSEMALVMEDLPDIHKIIQFKASEDIFLQIN